tara:strand:- start:15 stop:251 length:237 start_codon:yes stop_codon:yes gene_type:complete
MHFTVYSKEDCPYCSAIKQIMIGKDFKFTEYKLDEDFTKKEFLDEFGVGTTFPQVIMDGNKLGGCTDTVKYLRENKII